MSASKTSGTSRESPRAEPMVRAAGRNQPAAPRKARASVQGALAPNCTGASADDRSPSDLIPDLTNARAPLVAISFCTEGGDPPGSRAALFLLEWVTLDETANHRDPLACGEASLEGWTTTVRPLDGSGLGPFGPFLEHIPRT